MKSFQTLLFAFILLVNYNLTAQSSGYMTPPQAIIDIVDAPIAPIATASPDKEWILYAQRSSLPSLEELSQPELRIGGLRINPAVFARSRTRPFVTIRVQKTNEKMERGILGLPANPKIQHFSWSHDSKHFAFSNTTEKGLELWVVDLASRNARKLSNFYLNGTLTSPIEWIDNENLLVLATTSSPEDAPEKPMVPAGPNIKENLGTKAPARTYQDLLKNKHDEDLFTFYTMAQLTSISLDGTTRNLGTPSIYQSVEVSPDGLMIMANKIKQPYSTLVPYYRFPQDVEILNRSGERTHVIAEIPIQEKRPKGFDATQLGPRNHGWRSDAPHQIYYVEALDEGNPQVDADKRDAVYLLDAPFDKAPQKLFETTYRFRGIDWGNASTAIINERWWLNRKLVATQIDPSGKQTPKELVNRSYQDRYSDPGDPVMKVNDFGKYVLDISKQGDIYLTGSGASPEGDRPFIDQMNLTTGSTQRLWQSSAPYYEYPYVMLNAKKGLWLTSRETPVENPNYYIRNIKKEDKLIQLTSYPHPYPNLKGIQKEKIQYKRDDGLDLSADLYLPPGYKIEDGPLPTFVWAYPREYKNKEDAAQVSGSPYRFKSLSFYGPIPWVTQGYAVINNAAMPIIGEGDDEPNDSFREQLVASAKAAIDEGVRRGVTDRERVGIGGHSYGAFMTANLLAHSDLFKAGIARSGAYNRTLTPFGFQQEQRTYWEAPDVYFNMSPFMHAEKVNEPILLIHGEADNNSGTFPIQSARYYHALKGHGATVRYVTLPHESHGYRARESVLHMLYEMNSWMDKHVKNNKETVQP